MAERKMYLENHVSLLYQSTTYNQTKPKKFENLLAHIYNQIVVLVITGSLFKLYSRFVEFCSLYRSTLYTFVWGKTVSPIIEEETDSREVNPGEDVTFECIAEGLPDPGMKWLDPKGVTISNATDRVTVINRITSKDGVHGTVVISNLIIDNVLESDYGTYVCEAANSIGQPDVFRVHLNGTSEWIFMM